MSYVPVDICVKDTSPMQRPVSDVLVRVFSVDGRQVLTEGRTNIAGQVGFLLASGSLYQLRFFKPHVAVSPKLIDVIEPGTNTFDVPAAIVEPPLPRDARFCIAYGWFRTVTGAPAENVAIHFASRFKPLLLDGDAVVTESVDVRTDAAGYAEVSLLRFGQYHVSVEGIDAIEREITAPDAPNASITDLLFPVVARVVFDIGAPWMIPVGQELRVYPQVLMTDGRQLVGSATGEVRWSSSNRNVLTVAPAGAALVLRALAPGSAHVAAQRMNTRILRYPDVPIEGVPAAVTVT